MDIALNKVAENNFLYTYVVSSATEQPVTIRKGKEIAKFSFLTSDQAKIY